MSETRDMRGSMKKMLDGPDVSGAKFLSEDECRDVANRVIRFSRGGGNTWVFIHSEWHGSTRWARNEVHTAEDVRNDRVGIGRSIRGARIGAVSTFGNDISDRGLMAAVRRVERIISLRAEVPLRELADFSIESFDRPSLFTPATAQLGAEGRATVADSITKRAAEAGMLSAGYLEVSAHSLAAFDTMGRSLYFPYTQAKYTVTVRDPMGTASGWAGDISYDWGRINATKLSSIALDKCLTSRSPARVEPGRYTVVLEPQAVCDFVSGIVENNREATELMSNDPYNVRYLLTRVGEKIIDERITITSDPADPDCGFPPFAVENDTGIDSFVAYSHHPTTWIEHGVLKNIGYRRSYGIRALGQTQGHPYAGAFRMTGGTTSIEEMIATTQRGLYVTRFTDIMTIFEKNMLLRGYTRDGLWLIENGKITKPAKNLAFTESVLFALNNVEQMGVPQRVYHVDSLSDTPLSWAAYPQPVIVPSLKLREFSFTKLTDAV